MKRYLALDIDGTLTTDKYQIPKQVIEYLKKLNQNGWNIILTTGRTYSFTKKMLEQIDFPFLFSMQNGSTVLQLPQKEVLLHYSLHHDTLHTVKQIVSESEGFMIVYSGYHEGKDICYWKNHTLKEEYFAYVKTLKGREAEEWVQVEDLSSEEVKSLSLIKIVGTKDEMTSLMFLLKKNLLEEITLIQDPFDARYHLILITNPQATKGKTIEKLTKQEPSIVIAAGNDDNDYSLLQAADYRIAMPSSPKHLIEIADLVAPPVEEHGIISALEEAIKSVD